METANMDSDDDVIFVETEPVEIEVITLSDNETDTTSSAQIIPSLPVNDIKKKISSVVINTPTKLRCVSPSQLLSKNPLSNTSGVMQKMNCKRSGTKNLQKVQVNSKKSKKRKKRKNRIAKVVTNDMSQKKSMNNNKAWPNQPQVNDIQIQGQKAKLLSLVYDLNKYNKLKIKRGQNPPVQQPVANNNFQTQQGSHDVQHHGYENLPAQQSVANNSFQTQQGSHDVQHHGYENPLAEQPAANNNFQAQQGSHDVHQHGYENPPAEQPAANNNFQAQQGSHDVQHHGYENLPAQQSVANNNFQTQQGSHDVQHHGYENPPAEQPAANNNFQAQQGSHDVHQHEYENPPAQQPVANNNFQTQQGSHDVHQHGYEYPEFIFSILEYYDPFLSVILEDGYPHGQYLNEYHLFEVRKLVGFEIDSVMAGWNFSPKFLDSYVKNGVILVRSADAESQAWLQSIVPTLNPYPGVRLVIISPRELNQRYQVKISICNDTTKPQLILKRIQKQNPDIDIKSWELQSVQFLKDSKNTLNSGSILHISIPAYSAKILERKRFKLHYGLYQVNVELKNKF